MPLERPSSAGPDAGFTLLEMLVALTVLGVVLATLFRLAGDALVQYSGRESRLLLALTAEAAFNAELLEPGAAAATAWPDGLTVSVERRDLAATANRLEGLAATDGGLGQALDWLVVQAVDAAGRQFVLEAAVPRPRLPTAIPEPTFDEAPADGFELEP